MRDKKFNPDRIKALRNSLSLTQEKFASLIGPSIKRQHICQWEKGQQAPSADSLAKIANAFDVPIDYFFGENLLPQ